MILAYLAITALKKLRRTCKLTKSVPLGNITQGF